MYCSFAEAYTKTLIIKKINKMSSDIKNNNKPEISFETTCDAHYTKIKTRYGQQLRVIKWNDNRVQISIENWDRYSAFVECDPQDKEALKAFAIEILKQLD